MENKIKFKNKSTIIKNKSATLYTLMVIVYANLDDSENDSTPQLRDFIVYVWIHDKI